MSKIVRKHNHWQLTSELKELLLECRAESETRYAIAGVCVRENALVATDGRRLVEVQCTHRIEPGTYYVSEDGFLLETTELSFPKHEDIIPDKKEACQIVKTTEVMGEDVIGLILGELCHSGCITKLSFYQRPAEILSSIIDGEVCVFVHNKAPAEHPFLIEAETLLGKIRYVQMPVNVRNDIRPD